jgi:carboxyl-terminal processing protease
MASIRGDARVRTRSTGGPVLREHQAATSVRDWGAMVVVSNILLRPSPAIRRISAMAVVTLCLATFAWGDVTPQSTDRLEAALDVITNHYLVPLSREDAEEQALRALLKELDPYASYMDAREWSLYQESLSGGYGGVGVFISIDEQAGLPKVDYLLIDSPAGHAGVRRGDHLLKAGSQSLEGLTFEAVIALLRGAPGSVLELTVRHPGSAGAVTLAVERKRIPEPSVRGVRRDPTGKSQHLMDGHGGVGYIRILQFTDTTVAELETALAGLERQRFTGLILDLRDSIGGQLDAAIAAADLFLDGGEILTVVSRETREVFAAGPGRLTAVPMVLLLNEATASSAEVLAGALVDNGRAMAMGQRTYGKGRIQKFFSLGEGQGGLVLSTGTFQRPSGKTIDRHLAPGETGEAGIAPDPGLEMILEKPENEALADEMFRLDGPFIMTAEEQVVRVPDRLLARAVEVVNAAIEKGTGAGLRED